MNKDQIDFLGMQEDELVMLESLVKSPVWAALKKVLKQYRDSCQRALLTCNELHDIHRNQGRIIGLDAVEQLPALLVSRHLAKQKKAEEEKKAFHKSAQRPKNNGGLAAGPR